eukprot:jgi/Mesen1/9148/ME000587S08650
MFPEGQETLPMSKSILGLPQLQEVFLALPGMSRVHQLPPWLAELHACVALELLDQKRDKRLTSLTLLTSYAMVANCTGVLDVGRLQALQDLLLSCVMLDCVVGVARLPASTAVTVHCGCLVTTTQSVVYQAKCRKFESYAQYAGPGQKCQFLPLGHARQLFSDTRSRLAVGGVDSSITSTAFLLTPALPCLTPKRAQEVVTVFDLQQPERSLAYAGHLLPEGGHGNELTQRRTLRMGCSADAGNSNSSVLFATT